MTSLMIVITALNGAIQSGQLGAVPPRPVSGQTQLPDGSGGWYFLPYGGVRSVKIVDEEQEPLGPVLTPEEMEEMMEEELLALNPWWTMKLQMVDGFEQQFQILEAELGNEPSDGWIELTDLDGNKIWAREEDITSMSSNGPYWREN